MRSFEEFASVRDDLLARSARLESVWLDVRRFQENTDGLAAGGADHDDGDIVTDAIHQIRKRLNHTLLEVGVFGEVNRGKSTLLNALLGMEVSSMRVTPETAVPVWVERGAGDALVLYADGRVEQFDDPEKARERMTQRFRRLRPKDPVSRVVQRVDVDWLPEGVRVVDTPGLADPSLAQDYEELTLAELDRVAAAIFVFVSPPGIAREENRLLQSLAERGIEKVFLVCNFYPDQWAHNDARENVTRTIREIVQSHSDDPALLADKLQVFEVNAKQGLAAALSDDADGLESSGITALRGELERYLSEHAMLRLTRKCESLLDRGRATVISQLERRMLALSDRTELKTAQDQLARELAESRAVLEAIDDRCISDIATLRTRLEGIVAEPYEHASRLVSTATSKSALEGVSHKLRLASETAASLASTAYRNQVSVLEEWMRRRLFDSFGVDESFRTSRTVEVTPAAADVSVGVIDGEPDPSDVAFGTGVGLAAGGLIGGSLAGGAGIALLAAGPVGWLIGAGLGALAGATLGAHLMGGSHRDALTVGAREDLQGRIDQARTHTLTQVRDMCARLQVELRGSLSRQQERFFGDRAAELRRIEEILSDDSRVTDAIARARELQLRAEKV